MRAVQDFDTDSNVEVDDRGYIYIADRSDTGLHILELTGRARELYGGEGTVADRSR